MTTTPVVIAIGLDFGDHDEHGHAHGDGQGELPHGGHFGSPYSLLVVSTSTDVIFDSHGQ